jgi:hypothetical protein
MKSILLTLYCLFGHDPPLLCLTLLTGQECILAITQYNAGFVHKVFMI